VLYPFVFKFTLFLLVFETISSNKLQTLMDTVR